MTQFTDSPFERMMTQKPKSGRPPAVEPSSVLPDGHPCKGCGYGRDKPCVGICMKELQKEVPK